MSRTQRAWALVGIVVLVAAAVSGYVLWSIQNNATTTGLPSWLDSGQPPTGAAGESTTLPLSPDQSWAANRCRPAACSSIGLTAGLRVRRTYPSTLANDPDSIVRTGIDLKAGGNC